VVEVVVGDFGRALTVIEVRRYDEIVVVDVAIGDTSNVIVDAKALLYHDQCARGIGGTRDVDGEARRTRDDGHSKFGSAVRVRFSS
jgi:hypothetical protein